MGGVDHRRDFRSDLIDTVEIPRRASTLKSIGLVVFIRAPGLHPPTTAQAAPARPLRTEPAAPPAGQERLLGGWEIGIPGRDRICHHRPTGAKSRSPG